MKHSTGLWSLILTTGLILSACGGGGTGSATLPANTTVGVITGFGSIFVNGCEYDTDSASFTVDDNPSATEDNLNSGDMVKVTSSTACDKTTAKGTASNVSSSDELEGVVDSNSVAGGAGTMVVMGQTITVNTLTIFEDDTSGVATVNDITTGHVVEISGYSVGTGTIVASRIEVKYLSLAAALLADPGYEIEVKGLVSSLDTNTQMFNIGGLIVDYGSAIIDNSISGGLSDNLYVEVKAATYTPGAAFAATKVELEGNGEIGHHGSENDEVELRGLLTAYDAGKREVTIGSQTFVINDNTQVKDINGNDITASAGEAALASSTLGSVMLEGHGKFNAAGDLIAEEIEWVDSLTDNNECKGTVSALISTDLNTGTLTVNAAMVADCEGQASMDAIITNDTIMHDSSSASVSKFNLSYLRDGDTVEVHVDPGTGIAIRLERE